MSTPALPPLNVGECTITVRYAGPGDHTGKLHVDHADERIWISDALIAGTLMAFDGRRHPDINVTAGTWTYRLTGTTLPGWQLAERTTP